MPLALIGMLALCLTVRGRGDRRTAGLFVLGGWFLVELLVLDFSAGIVHPYYSSALGPGLAAMVGAGAVAIGSLVRNSQARLAMRGFVLAVLAVAGTVAVELILVDREGDPLWWRIPLVLLCLGGLVAIPLARARAGWALAVAVGALLVTPMAYSFSVWLAPVNGTFPAAGPYSYPGQGGYGVGPVSLRVDRRLIRYLHAHGATEPYALFTQSSDQASPLILLGLRAAAAGGYNTTDPALSGERAGHAGGRTQGPLLARRRPLLCARRQRRLDGGAARLPGDTSPDLVLWDQQRAWLLSGGLRRQGERAAPSIPLRTRVHRQVRSEVPAVPAATLRSLTGGDRRQGAP